MLNSAYFGLIVLLVDECLWGSTLIGDCWLFTDTAALWVVCTVMLVLYLLRRVGFFVVVVWVAFGR